MFAILHHHTSMFEGICVSPLSPYTHNCAHIRSLKKEKKGSIELSIGLADT